MSSSHNWFSELFGIDKPQYELPFIDCNLHADVPLYLDPYAIAKDPSELAAHCHNTILSYFQTLLNAIRGGNRHDLRHLLSGHLSEPNQLRLGVSKTAGGGRGIGGMQETAIVEAFRNSNAAKAGVIEAIQEMELHIENIGPDKISDLIGNIILGHLARFTEEICAHEGVSTRPCPVDGYWNPATSEWDSGYFNLPNHDLSSFILVPKRFVRRQKNLMHHRTFYQKYILETLQRELQTSNDSLVKTLKKGTRVVTKKDLQSDPRFELSKDFISEFIIDHPSVINQYRNALRKGFNPVDPAEVSGKSAQDDPGVRAALARLKDIVPGDDMAETYHETVFTLIQFVFDQQLENFTKEYRMDAGRGRIDIIADNCANGGFFLDARQDFNAGTAPMECKNYGGALGNDEFNQISDRLSRTTSRLGMLFCRTITNRSAVSSHITDRWLRHEKMILVIDDTRLSELVELRLARNFPRIDSSIRRLVRDVQYRNPG